MTQKQITLGYILGLMETDGSIQLMFGTGKSRTTLKAWIRISQKSNLNLLALIKTWFEKNGIECYYEVWNPNTSRNRAPNLTITKVGSIRKFIELVKNEPLQFINQKQRDFLILDLVMNSSTQLSITDKINLKKSMHKAHANQPDINPKGSKSREELELKYGIPLGSSQKDTLGLLKTIDAQYVKHINNIKKQIAQSKLKVSADWLAGLIDGDGSYYVTMRVKNPTARYNKRYIEFLGAFTISMELNALLTLEVIKFIIGSNTPIVKSKKKQSYQIWIRKQAEVKQLLQMQLQYLPVGDHRRKQYELVQNLFDCKNQGKMRDLNTVLNVIRAAYAMSETTKGRRRTVSLDKMIAIATEIYG